MNKSPGQGRNNTKPAEHSRQLQPSINLTEDTALPAASHINLEMFILCVI